MRPVAGLVPPLAIVHHVGHKSGRGYRTPVLAFPVAEGYLTPLPYGVDTDWCRNVLEADRCRLERLGRMVEVGNPRVVQADAALPLLPVLMRPALRLANLPGYLLVDRERKQRPPRAARRGSRQRAGAR